MAIITGDARACKIVAKLHHPNDVDEGRLVYVVDYAWPRSSNEELFVYDPKEISIVAGTDEWDEFTQLPVDSLPCYARFINAMRRFGYEWRGMLPLDRQTALNLFHEGATVYLLYSGGSESKVEKDDEIEEDRIDVLYGITVWDWLVHCGRIVDGEIVKDGVSCNMSPSDQLNVKVRAITEATGEEIEGYLVVCNGLINKGRAYVCPEVKSVEASHNGADPAQCVLGHFYRVLPDTIKRVEPKAQAPIGLALAELEAYRNTGLTPKDIQEAVDLFKDSNLSVPEEIKGWVNRATFHTRKCVELEEKVRLLEVQLAGFQVEAMHRMKDKLLKRLEHERRTHIEYVVHEEDLGIPDDGYDVMSNPLVAKASNLALDKAIVEVFEDCNLQYMQCMALVDYEDDLLQAFFEEVKKVEKYSYGEAEIKDAIFNVVSSLLSKYEG